MTSQNRAFKLALVFLGSISAVSLASRSNSLATTVTPSGSYNGTFVTSGVTFDGFNFAGLDTVSGSDNVGGTGNAQGIAEYALTSSGSCTLADGSAGSLFPLATTTAEVAAVTYSTGQIFSAVAPGPNSICVNADFTEFNGLITLRITGGNGKFAHASGTVTETATGQYLAFPGLTPPGSGAFGAVQYKLTGGSITY
jgi:hypothetical protein